MKNSNFSVESIFVKLFCYKASEIDVKWLPTKANTNECKKKYIIELKVTDQKG